VRLYSRPGNDLTDRFPLIVDALARLRASSCIVDGEAASCGDDGIASFERMRDGRHGDSVFLWAFDLIELNGDDLRRDPLAVRKATLASLVARVAPGLHLNEHLDHDDGRSSSSMPASSGSKGLSRSGTTRRIGQAARGIGSRARTRTRPPRSERLRTGGDSRSQTGDIPAADNAFAAMAAAICSAAQADASATMNADGCRMMCRLAMGLSAPTFGRIGARQQGAGLGGDRRPLSGQTGQGRGLRLRRITGENDPLLPFDNRFAVMHNSVLAPAVC
jgi:hypothetical protein